MSIHILTLFEIEHTGDLDDAIDILYEAGFKNVDPIRSYYDDGETTFRVRLDDGQDINAVLTKARALGICD